MRTRLVNERPESSRNRQPTPPPNPPPAPTLADAIANLAKVVAGNARVLQAMAQDRAPTPQPNQHQQGNNTYADFLKTHPPVFLKADEPLEADDWIGTIEQKLALIRCTDAQKTQYAAQQLQGPARGWWSNFRATQPNRDNIPWATF